MTIEENPFEHILYEFSMYLQASIIRCNVQFVTNSLEDSRMVHLRNLAYFFCSKRDNMKNYFHYSDFIDERIENEVEHDLYNKIQNVTSNSTCHLLKGRLNKSLKSDTMQFEQDVLPIFVNLIKNYIQRLNENVKDGFLKEWNSDEIQKRSSEIMKTIQEYESAKKNTNVFDMSNTVGTATTSSYFVFCNEQWE